MKYTKEQLEAKSDCELNCIIGEIGSREQGVVIIVSDMRVFSTDLHGAFPVVDELDYCNNPGDMMPLVFECGISMHPRGDSDFEIGTCWLTGEWSASAIDYGDDNEASMSAEFFESKSDSPLRAAAIVYILVRQGEAV